MLSCEIIVHFVDSLDEVGSRIRKLGKLKILGAGLGVRYLQKCFFLGKQACPLKVTPYTM